MSKYDSLPGHHDRFQKEQRLAGTYTQVEPHRLIEYAFGDRRGLVVFTNTPAGVRVEVTFDSEPTHSLNSRRDGWQAILNNFRRHVERKS